VPAFSGSLKSIFNYTYTIHSHLAENEAVIIFPNEKGIVFDYEISTRNISPGSPLELSLLLTILL